MKLSLLTFSVLIAFVAATIASAQTDCPNFEVASPAGIVNPGGLVWFLVDESAMTGDVTFNWTVKNGTIQSGQGTSRIQVRPVKYFAEPVEATLRVGGLPPSCPATFSERYSVSCDPYLFIDGQVSFWSTYDQVPWKSEQAALDSLFLKGLQKTPEKIAYIERAFPASTEKREIDATLNRIRQYVHKTLRIPKNKLFIRPMLDYQTTRLFLVPDTAPVLDPKWTEPCFQ